MTAAVGCGARRVACPVQRIATSFATWHASLVAAHRPSGLLIVFSILPLSSGLGLPLRSGKLCTPHGSFRAQLTKSQGLQSTRSYTSPLRPRKLRPHGGGTDAFRVAKRQVRSIYCRSALSIVGPQAACGPKCTPGNSICKLIRPRTACACHLKYFETSARTWLAKTPSRTSLLLGQHAACLR